MNARTDIRPMGLVKGLDFAEYHAVDALSASGMRHLARSPWHFANRVEITPTRPMLRGTLAHCALLEPTAMDDRYVVVPADAPKKPTEAQWNAKKSNESSQAAKDWWTEFGEEVAGRTIVPAEDFAITQLQLAAIAANPLLAELFASGYGEASVFWIDEATGVYCKARPDWVCEVDDVWVDLADLKSTADESPSGFGRASARMGYHRQAAHYIAGFEAATGRRVRNFVFAAVTSARPVLAVPYLLAEEIAEQGADECRELIERYAFCLKEGRWPTYGDGFQLLDFPAYAKRSGEVEVGFIED
jgi:hypothetical protein